MDIPPSLGSLPASYTRTRPDVNARPVAPPAHAHTVACGAERSVECAETVDAGG
jgi:hypothetical protein